MKDLDIFLKTGVYIFKFFLRFLTLISPQKKKLKCFLPHIGISSTHSAIMSSISNSNNTTPQIYIPRVLTHVTWQEMKSVFDEVLGEGAVKRVDIVKVKQRDGDKAPNFNRAYVHIKQWPSGTEDVRDQLLAGETVKLYPDGGDTFWMCVLNSKAQEQAPPKGKPCFERTQPAPGRATMGDAVKKAGLNVSFAALSVEDPEGEGEEATEA